MIEAREWRSREHEVTSKNLRDRALMNLTERVALLGQAVRHEHYRDELDLAEIQGVRATIEEALARLGALSDD